MEDWFNRMTTSSNLRISDDFLTVTFEHPGLGYSMLDRDDHPSITSLMFLCYTARSIAIRGRNESCQYILNWDWTQDQRLEFVVSSELDVAHDMYSKVKVMRQLLCEFSVVDAGTTSMATRTTFYMAGGSKPVLTLVQRTVSVDAWSRKPKAYPSRVLQAVKRGGQGKGLSLKHIGRVQRPPNTFVHSVTVSWTDTDGYNHCNFTSYSRFVVDAIHSVLRTDRMHPPINKQSSQAANITPQEIRVLNKDCVEASKTKTPTSPGNHASGFSHTAILDEQKPDSKRHTHDSSLKAYQEKQTHIYYESSRADEGFVSETSKLKGNECNSSPTEGKKHISRFAPNRTLPENVIFKNISDDVIKSGIKTFKIRYFKECVEGERLDVHIWQDGAKTDGMVFSSIERSGDVICQIALEYFNTVSKL